MYMHTQHADVIDLTYLSSDHWESIDATITWHHAAANNCLQLT